MQHSKIEWLKDATGNLGYSINPVKGLCPEACEFCYARRMYKRFKWPEYLRLDPICAESLFNIKKPSKIFIGSTMELFGEWIRPEWMQFIFRTVKTFPEHTFIFLTKKPENLQKWSPFPDNCWIGATTHTAWSYDEAIEHLQHIEAPLKFLSFEPLCDRIDIHSKQLEKAGIKWVILGQETPISKKVHLPWQWFSEVVEAADNATPHIPVFLKNNLSGLLPAQPPFMVIPPISLRQAVKQNLLRQEFPQ